MRGSIVLAFIAVCLSGLWHHAATGPRHDVIGLRADGSPLYEPLVVGAVPGSAVSTTAQPASHREPVPAHSRSALR